MNKTFDDVQSHRDHRNIPVDQVGIKGIKHPVLFEDRSTHLGDFTSQPVVATLDMMVNLPKDIKGTHMSRFVEILNDQVVTLKLDNIPYWLDLMATKLEAEHCFLKANFDFFIEKFAPISKVKSLMDYQATLEGVLYHQKPYIFVTLIIPVTSLCPCSKALAQYGAHNQRSHIKLTLEADTGLSIKQIIQSVEQQASSELFGIVKRQDEKFITEQAYENPKFVEDMVRDIANTLENDPYILGYRVSSENFESIHNHSAYACIDRILHREVLRLL